jgi:aminoglycoside phosphotransferase (APT) family kinase protein
LTLKDQPNASPVLIHGDIGDHNLLRRGDGTLVLLDWEISAVADPLIDIAWLFARQGWGKREREAFFRAYRVPLDQPYLIDFLGRLCLLDQAVWAWSCLNDIEERRNTGILGPAQLPFLRACLEFFDTI